MPEFIMQAAPVNFTEMFHNGLKRDLGVVLPPPGGKQPILNLGPGNNPIAGTIGLDAPKWRAPRLPMYPNDSVRAVHAHHFMEHLSYHEVIVMLKEVDRVLMRGGVMNITVPHAQSAMGFGAADHKTFWTEKTWRDLFYGQNYDARFGVRWDLNISFMAIAGINFHELCLLVQLVKDPNHASLWINKR